MLTTFPLQVPRLPGRPRDWRSERVAFWIPLHSRRLGLLTTAGNPPILKATTARKRGLLATIASGGDR